ncbi:unnamed protein product [Closterium sp. Naga37s-1]|nr:unnamed protein product [Closterium sp. Naga37s-1]
MLTGYLPASMIALTKLEFLEYTPQVPPGLVTCPPSEKVQCGAMEATGNSIIVPYCTKCSDFCIFCFVQSESLLKHSSFVCNVCFPFFHQTPPLIPPQPSLPSQHLPPLGWNADVVKYPPPAPSPSPPPPSPPTSPPFVPSPPPLPPPSSSGLSVGAIAGIVVAGVSVLALLLLLPLLFFRRRKAGKPFSQIDNDAAAAAATASAAAAGGAGCSGSASGSKGPSGPAQAAAGPAVCRQYRLDVLAAATGMWEEANKIGSGGFGDVYRAEDPADPSTLWAVKRAKVLTNDFRREVGRLGFGWKGAEVGGGEWG